MREFKGRIACAALVACLFAPSASAQTTVRVLVDGATIYKTDFSAAAAVVNAGTTLTVVGTVKDWYEVTIPGAGNAGAQRGYIFKELVAKGDAARPGAPYREREAGASPSERTHLIGGAAYGQFGYTRFAAHQSFNAVLGSAGGPVVGGGGELRIGRGLFVGGSAEHFSKSGQRVVVAGGEVFGLGIADTVTLTPLQVTAGWRLDHPRFTPYGGGGLGAVYYREESAFADPSENVSRRFSSYHVLGGLEVRDGWIATAFEVQYSRVPDAIGVAGASAAFQEFDLGGIAARIKVVVGR